MKDYAIKIKKRLNDESLIYKLIFISVLLTFSIVYFLNATLNHDINLPNKPLNDFAENSSFVPLKGDFKHLLDNEKNDETDNNDQDKDNNQDNQEENKDEDDKQEEKEDKVDNSDDRELQDQEEEKGNKGEGIHKNSDASNIEIIDNPNGKNDENKNEYFTTTIINDEIVTEEEYSFRIIQKKHSFIVTNTEVFLNDKSIEDFHGFLLLQEGDNTIKIKVTYTDNHGEVFSVSKSYNVTLNTKDIVIYTDLEDNSVFKDKEINFKASAKYEGKDVPVTIEINGKTINEASPNNYKTQLKKDSNQIVLYAKYKGKAADKKVTVYYQPEESNLLIETDLKDQSVTEEKFSFFAIAKKDNDTLPLKVTVNDELITDDTKGNYHTVLTEGLNKIIVSAEHNEQKVEKQYSINYRMPDGGNENDEIDSDIYIEFPDLKDGQTIKNSVHTFHVKAVDKNGKQITDRGISIKAQNNGKNIPIDWNNESHVSFTLSVVDGTNYIEVTAKDSQGSIGTANLTVYGDIADDNEVIGAITFSLEASTIGLGHIIPSQQVELYPNERGSYTIDRIFEEYGITYDYTGSHSDSFYLSRIYKSGLVANPKVPDDLAELVERDFSVFNPTNFDVNSLGEFDISNGGGWMYSVNGHYPNVGFADYYFKDGDVVRIRFTIALGMDIGGGMPGSNYGKEW